MNKETPILSLFSGAGGLDLGFRLESFEPVLALDHSPAAVDTYNENHPPVARLADLHAYTAEDVMQTLERAGRIHPVGVLGGPPCQAFSSGNVFQTDDDPRRGLVDAYADMVIRLDELVGIDFFVFENVVGLTSSRHYALFEVFLQRLQHAGFDVQHQIVNAVDFGVPQRRARLIVVGLRNTGSDTAPFVFPTPGSKAPLTVRDAVGGLPEPTLFSRGLDPSDFPVHRNHWAMVPRSRKFTDGSLVEGSSRGRSFRVLEWDKPSRTVAYGNREVHIHPRGHRRLSVFEAMLLQGFPPEYVLKGTLSDQFRLVSDAVPPPLGRALARQVRSALTFDAAQVDEIVKDGASVAAAPVD